MISRNTRVILKTFTVIMLCIFIGVSLYGDDGKDEKKTDPSNNLEITYDFATGKFVDPKSVTDPKGVTDQKYGQFVVKKGQNIVFTIINFNRLAFKATINGEQVSDNTNSTVPGQFSIIQPKKAEIEITAFQCTLESLRKVTPLEKMDDAIKNLSSLKTLRDGLDEAVNTASTYSHFESLKNQVLEKFLGKLPGDPNTVNSKVLNKVNEIIKESGNKINKVKEEIKKHEEQSKKIIASLDELEKIKNDQVKLKKIKEIENDKKTLNNIWITSENCRDFSSKLSQLENLLKEIKDNNYIDQVKDLLSNIKEENFSVSLTIPSVEGDSVKISVTIEPVDKKKNQVYHQLQNPIIVYVKGGWKIDFSTGVFFIVNKQKRTYWVEEIEGEANVDSTKVILRENKGKTEFTPIIGALMHVYPRRTRITRDVNWAGFAFGLGTGEVNNLSYYLGTGIMFGSQNRFLINVGGTMIKVDSLLPKYRGKIDQAIKRPTDNDGSLVESIYKLRFFISLTYNI